MRITLTRLKLAHVLPPAQVILAGTSMLLARHSHPPLSGDIYWHPTFELVCAGLNAPVDQLSIILYSLLGPWVGVFSGDLIYLVLVASLWYSVGRKIDSYRFPRTSNQKGAPIAGTLTNIIVAIYGLYLLVFISLHNVIFTDPKNGNMGSSNGLGDLIRQTLWFLWSVGLIVVPTATLASALRPKPHSSATQD
jgi:hypothetical protein